MTGIRHEATRLARVLTVLAMLVTTAASADPLEVRDTVAVEADAPPRVAALAWEPATFNVWTLETPGADADAILRFPSPVAIDAHTDRAALLWYRPADLETQASSLPAIVIVHSLHPDQPFAKMLARMIRTRGIHAFVLQLPGYGLRRVPGRHTGVTAVERSRQAVADIRRARDLVAALPGVGEVSLAGISLGGFAAATSASLDDAWENVFLITTGAGLADVLQRGSKDARLLRMTLADHGYDDAKLAALLDPVDPQHLADRLDPTRTWLFSARHDVTIPQANIKLLADTIGLAADRHVWLESNHYTAIFALPGIAQQIADTMAMQ